MIQCVEGIVKTCKKDKYMDILKTGNDDNVSRVSLIALRLAFTERVLRYKP